ncbi:monocarboxylate transporter [Elysia marginata]|uniref:Monocarboxylate transporter n=1 Tax=Elysia marginata TaxID=1093978 RepID=A0AAV4F2M8_9GAST|nr:monocarboxylate transporter [Elysia marginata]
MRNKGDAADVEEILYLAKDQGDEHHVTDKTPLVPAQPSPMQLNKHRDEDGDDDMYNNDDEEEEDEDVVDGTFGWVIVLGGFLTQMVNVGLMRTDGIYFLQFRARFHENAQLSAWPGATSLTIQSFMGPVATALCNRFSVRTTVILATVFNVSGLALSGYCTHISQLFFTYGILQGIGRGLTITPGIFLVNMYFNKMRARAIGMSMTGAGLGTFAMVPLHQWLFDTFGFTNAYLMIAAIATSGFLAAALFRPLSMHKEIKREQRLKERALRKQTNGIAQGVLNEGSKIFVDEKARNSLKQSEREVESLLKDKTVPTGTRCGNQQDFNYISLCEMPNSIEKASCIKSVLRTCFPIEHKQGISNNGEKRKIFHFELLKDIPFLILCMCMVFFNIANKIFFSFLPALGTSKGLSEPEASLLISACGVGDIFGRGAAGFVMDQPWVIPEVFYGSVLFICAGATALLTVAQGFGMFCVGAALFGCFGGVSISQKTTLLAGILGKDILTTSFGIMYCSQGFGTLLGPPISGAMKDALGSYDYPFYLTAGCLTFSGFLFIISCLLFAVRRRRRKEKEEEEQQKEGFSSSENSDETSRDCSDDAERGLLDRREKADDNDGDNDEK